MNRQSIVSKARKMRRQLKRRRVLARSRALFSAMGKPLPASDAHAWRALLRVNRRFRTAFRASSVSVSEMASALQMLSNASSSADRLGLKLGCVDYVPETRQNNGS